LQKIKKEPVLNASALFFWKPKKLIFRLSSDSLDVILHKEFMATN